MECVPLKDICAELRIKNPSDVAKRVRNCMPDHIKKEKHRDRIGRWRQTIVVTPEAVNFIKSRQNKKQLNGFVYGFNPIGSATVYKFGRTNDWAKRTYIGLNKPRHVVLLTAVKDQHTAERDLLKFICAHSSFTQRDDLGREWFETNLPPIEVKAICSRFVTN